jgi:hypothetical protein
MIFIISFWKLNSWKGGINKWFDTLPSVLTLLNHACLLKPTPEVSAGLLPLTAGAPGVLLPAEGGNGKLRVTGETRGDRT